MNRGCGTRKPGGLYAVTKLGPFGRPIEDFIIDPPVPYEGEKFRAPQIIERDGVNHLLLWVGETYYPSPADFIEEVRVFGASKRIPVKFPVEKLTPFSVMFFVHPKALIRNWNVLPAPVYCPKENDSHLGNTEYCVGHTYQVPEDHSPSRKIGDTEYVVYPCVIKEELQYGAGIFLRLPITNLEYVVGKEHQPVDPAVAKKIGHTAVPIDVVEE
jgi:hypothetical protein